MYVFQENKTSYNLDVSRPGLNLWAYILAARWSCSEMCNSNVFDNYVKIAVVQYTISNNRIHASTHTHTTLEWHYR